jgi:tetratricopeptide (TPR) repeat protein
MALLQSHLCLGDLDAAQRRAEMIQRLESTSKELRAFEKDVIGLVKRRDKTLADWDAGKEQPDAARRIVNRCLCAERGIAERWPPEQIERLLQDVSNDRLDYSPYATLRAWLALEHGQIRTAITYADAAIKLEPSYFQAFLVRGRARLEQGKINGALSDLRKATELSKREDGIVLHWFAAALLDAGRVQEAVETQRLALLLRPNDVELQDQLRRLEIKSKETTGGQ